MTLFGDSLWTDERIAEQGYGTSPRTVLCPRIVSNWRPPAEAYEVREKIEKALSRVAPFDAQKISIKTDGGTATFGGNVRNWYERDLVGTSAWAAPGVTQVQDNIAVIW